MIIDIVKFEAVAQCFYEGLLKPSCGGNGWHKGLRLPATRALQPTLLSLPCTFATTHSIPNSRLPLFDTSPYPDNARRGCRLKRQWPRHRLNLYMVVLISNFPCIY